MNTRQRLIVAAVVGAILAAVAAAYALVGSAVDVGVDDVVGWAVFGLAGAAVVFGVLAAAAGVRQLYRKAGDR